MPSDPVRSLLFASALREQLEIQGRVDLDVVAKELRLSIREAALTGCDGALLRSSVDCSGIIVVKKSIRELGRKRFTVAHEIGHRVLHGPSAACAPSDVGNWSVDATNIEKEADEFAAELLLPSKEIATVINSRGPSLQTIQSLATEYGASLSASAWRYCDVSSVPCAVIWSTNELIQWWRKSDSFPFFLKRGIEVPKASYAMEAYRGRMLPDGPEPVAAHEWIDSGRLRDAAEVWEQSMPMPYYNSVISLLWVKREITRQEPNQDLLEELDPDEFTIRRKRWPGKR